MTLAQNTQNINPLDTIPFHYAGFSTPNTTSVPDDFFDVLAPNLSEAELRVLIYVIRRTFGFKKDLDTISLKQMVEGITTREGKVLDRGTGMSRPGVTSVGSKEVVEHVVHSPSCKHPFWSVH